MWKIENLNFKIPSFVIYRKTPFYIFDHFYKVRLSFRCKKTKDDNIYKIEDKKKITVKQSNNFIRSLNKNLMLYFL